MTEEVLNQLSEENEALKEQIENLEEQLEMITHVHDHHVMQKRIEKLEDALRPFADVWAKFGGEHLQASIYKGSPMPKMELSRFPFWKAYEVLNNE